MADMRTTYEDMLKFFDENAQDPTPILEGNSPFPDVYVNRDNFLQLLLDADQQLDGLTASSMAMMMQSLAIFARRQFQDFLPGGKYAALTPEQCLGVPKTNKKCESYFAQWDREVCCTKMKFPPPTTPLLLLLLCHLCLCRRHHSCLFRRHRVCRCFLFLLFFSFL